MPHSYLVDLASRWRSRTMGNKAKKLRFLLRHQFPVPATLVCSSDAYLRYRAGDPHVAHHLRSELRKKLDPDKTYAVRSSASIEDGQDHSFAGQFKTRLDVQGVDGVAQAIQEVWEAAQAASVATYAHRAGVDAADLSMGVIIQEMVQPVISGVSFSKNPMTGMDEVVVEAVRGSGEKLLQEGVTPERWVNKWGRWVFASEEQGIGLDLIEKVVQQTRSIAKAYGQAVDLEWVYDGRELYWVQLREITALDQINLYSNQISKEFFPGLVKPLVWSINVPLVNGAWVRLFTEMIGPNDIDPYHLAELFYYRAYFNMGAVGQILELVGFPRETIELLLGLEIEGPDKPSFRPTPKTFSLLPRLLLFAGHKLGVARRMDRFLPAMEAELAACPAGEADQLEEAQLVSRIEQLYALAQETAYRNIEVQLSQAVYTRLLKGQLSRQGVSLEEFDLTSGMKELEPLEPNVHLLRLHQQYRELEPEQRATVRDSDFEQFRRLPGIEDLQQGVVRFIQQFGHLSDSSNDFSYPSWRENPDWILTMVVEGVPARSPAPSRVGFESLQTKPPRRWILATVYNRARRFRWYREAVGSLYAYCYDLFRTYFLALGERFAQQSLLDAGEDIFYLHFDEIKETVRQEFAEDLRDLIAQRKREMEACRNITPPDIIYGDGPVSLESEEVTKLQGTPTSRGRYTGPARVVQGIQDFEKVQAGDVLVIPYSDVGWTPLFSRAGAVVAEAGGILSHSSVIAREYGIPAVVSVSGACGLADNSTVSVDGYRGEIIVHDEREL
jgi:pyruvate,water dikinase